MEIAYAPFLLFLLCVAASQTIDSKADTNIKEQETATVSGTDETWDKINRKTVEQVCLDEAKRYAGENSWAISGCGCEGTETTEIKEYSCTIKTIYKDFSLDISCYRNEEMCSYSSNQGSGTITFDQIEQRY